MNAFRLLQTFGYKTRATLNRGLSAPQAMLPDLDDDDDELPAMTSRDTAAGPSDVM